MRVGRAQRAAVEEAGALLRELGHEVIERDPDYPPSAVYGHALPRYFRGVYDDVKALPHPERLEAGPAHSRGSVACCRTSGYRRSGERKA